MIKLNIAQVAEILGATLVGSADVEVENISTDTRQKVEKGLFFALKGENFDGHDYVCAAAAAGCCALVVQQACDIALPQIIVKDTRLALGQLAHWLRREINPLTVAITGSSGKTTVKEMTAAILQHTAQDPSQVLFTQGNFNNDIGVPLTLLRLNPAHRFAVIELGANHQGEIAYSTDLVQPNVALVNNVAPAHLEGFGSIEGVARAKGEIYRGLPPDGIALINLDCHYLPNTGNTGWGKEIDGRKVCSFSAHNPKADYYAREVKISENGATFILHSPAGETLIELPYLGAHNVSNALAAAALAMSVGASLAEVKGGLEHKTQVKGRLFPIRPCRNLLLLDDTYNANVDSLKSAISVLRQYKAFRILVVGDMAELGENSRSCHQQVAEFAQQAQLDLVASFGRKSAPIAMACRGIHFTDKVGMAAYLSDVIKEKLDNNQRVVLLAKGSRSMKMEQVIEILKDNFVC
ncbi:UDP-N-acetylmuramoyl-tripeptide--D-alanyl-D-alanine ligase [Mesocricetibacter intestinalis]|uniref:UDP-N-acetylmuramoyl-tripeptide--D-alanyl-D-alanine ligase n=1 Tax=Mesocricetibacter intestinalis TaxID=1521930 RepID=A0A4R6VCN0_9PAST|nr:UDP-N-acetylmuramoyl-tripeptide--D-alanyl-D-alanine ligase [Mesocricetibacter intestinalis]TDQ57995.1 UDP-N-acetylmuramoyl-tripeptide--D-alanyl-D-alanine ligase [Mesocricetibacter intestinalis]